MVRSLLLLPQLDPCLRSYRVLKLACYRGGAAHSAAKLGTLQASDICRRHRTLTGLAIFACHLEGVTSRAKTLFGHHQRLVKVYRHRIRVIPPRSGDKQGRQNALHKGQSALLIGAKQRIHWPMSERPSKCTANHI